MMPRDGTVRTLPSKNGMTPTIFPLFRRPAPEPSIILYITCHILSTMYTYLCLVGHEGVRLSREYACECAQA